MRLSSKQILGILLIVISVVTLVQAVRQVRPLPYTIDFPCFADEDVRREGLNANTRLAYCLSFWPFNVGGGGIYALGTSDQDEARVGGLRFRREGGTLYVNNRPVDVGVRYETVRWTASRNPWLILTDRFEIRNAGLISASSTAPPNVLFISGDVHQGWLPNPLGFIMIFAGMLLVLREFRA
ncbi:MAG TPA: hypothetical protein VI451_04335 [Anaerolineales bacterium]|nr:hypothetical protein [Anaerolineales bacterium]